MATITLVANANYSALTVGNNDTIALAGFTLNLDIDPAQTGVTVTAAGNTGKITLGTPTSYTLSDWTLKAGTATLLDINPASTSVGGKFVGGSANGAYGIANNYGTATATGGSASGAHGIANNYGTATATGGPANGTYGIANNYGTATATGGSANNANGIANNYGTATATGGSANNANGIGNNYGTATATGGSAFNANGIINNYGTATATGGSASGAHGIAINHGTILALDAPMIDNTARAISSSGPYAGKRTIVCRGEYLQCVVPSGFSAIYYTGTINPMATINGFPALIKLDSAGTTYQRDALGTLIDPLDAMGGE